MSRLRALRRRAAPACVACCWARTGLQRLDLDLAVAATVDLVRHKGAVSRCRVQSSPARRRCGCASLSSSLTAHTTHNQQQENHQADSLKWCAIHLSATIRAYWQQLTPCAVAAPPVCQSALWTTATLPSSQRRTMFRPRPRCCTPTSSGHSSSARRGSRATINTYTILSSFGACCVERRASRRGALARQSPRTGSRRRRFHRLRRLQIRCRSEATTQTQTMVSWLFKLCLAALAALGVVKDRGAAGSSSLMRNSSGGESAESWTSTSKRDGTRAALPRSHRCTSTHILCDACSSVAPAHYGAARRAAQAAKHCKECRR